MGLCPTRYLPFAGDVAAYRAWDSIKTVEIAWTRVNAISDYNTCLKEENKWMKIEGLPCDTWKTLERWIFIAAIFSHPRDCDLTVTVTCDRDHPLHLKISSDGVGDAWKNTTIAVRSNRDRGAIEPRSWILPHGIYPTIIERQFPRIRSTIDARSWSIVVDRVKIVADFEALFEAKFKPIRRGFEATKPCKRNCPHDV